MQVGITRRHVIGASTALLLGVKALEVAGQDSATPEGAPVSALPSELPQGGIQDDGGWSFTDDLGVTVESSAVPTKVVAHVGMAAALFDFGFEVVGIYNPATDEDGNPLQIAGDLPLDRITHVGNGDEIDIELLISLGAELFIGQNYSVETGGMWPFGDDVLNQINQAFFCVWRWRHSRPQHRITGEPRYSAGCGHRHTGDRR